MITPDFLNEIIKGIEEATAKMNESVLREVSRKVADVFDVGGKKNGKVPKSVADLMQKARRGYDVQNVRKAIDKNLPGIQHEVRRAFRKATAEIAEYIGGYTKEVAQGVGVELPDWGESQILSAQERQIIEDAYRRTSKEILNLTRTTASSAYGEYIRGCDTAFLKVKAGVPLHEAVLQSVHELAGRGIQTVTYPSGHKDLIDVAIARAVRTGINQANAEALLQRCADIGIGYVRTSQHLGARVTKENDYTNHSWWQGGIYKLDWGKAPLDRYGEVNANEPKYSIFQRIKKALFKKDVFNYPDFVETCGYGDVQGIVGANCRHTFEMWRPGIDKDKREPIDKDENEARYRAEQRQRAYEREIRKLRREIAADNSINTALSRGQAGSLQKELNDRIIEYAFFSEQNGMRPYWERTEI